MCVCVCPHASACVLALKREDSCAEYTGRGETLFLPSSYFLLNSCVSVGGWGAQKKGRKGNDILALQLELVPHTLMYGF